MKTFKYAFSVIAVILLIGILYFLNRISVNADSIRSGGTQVRVVLADTVGVPLQDVKNPAVAVIPESRQGTRTTTSKDQQGYYVVPLSDVGRYTVEASVEGYVPQTRVITIQRNEVLDLIFFLKEK